MKDLEAEVKYWQDKSEHNEAQFLSMRDLYNREYRNNDIPEVRMLKAQLADKRISDRKLLKEN